MHTTIPLPHLPHLQLDQQQDPARMSTAATAVPPWRRMGVRGSSAQLPRVCLVRSRPLQRKATRVEPGCHLSATRTAGRCVSVLVWPKTSPAAPTATVDVSSTPVAPTRSAARACAHLRVSSFKITVARVVTPFAVRSRLVMMKPVVFFADCRHV